MKPGKQNDDVTQERRCCAMERLAKECFAGSVSSHYELSCPLPVLKSTSLNIMKLKNVAKKNLSVDDVGVKAAAIQQGGVGKKSPLPLRSQSTDLSRKTSDERLEDLQLVQACFCVISSFMHDHHEQLNKGQNTNLFESTVADRRKNYIQKRRLWNRSSSSGSTEDTNNGDNKTPSPAQRRGRPRSAYFTVDSGYESDRSNLSKNGIDSSVLEKMTVLEKVQFIASIGISLIELRDEIYCQILKQTNGNPSLRSVALGWILLTLLAPCFSPSVVILPYVKGVLMETDTVGSAYCAERLSSVLEKGERTTPPCSLELQAAKLRQKVRLPIVCMDQSVRTVWVDSLTTVAEMCQKVASKNRLGDAFGFSITFAFDNKVVPLGGGDFYIMDAISQAERYASVNDIRDTWRIYFRREFFSPRDAAGLHDSYMKSWLTYSQICGGVQTGEYECFKAQDLALLLAHQYCVRNSDTWDSEIKERKCTALCQHALPASIPKEDRKKWVRMVISTLEALQGKERERGKLKEVDIMEQIIRYSSRAFIVNFTKSFILSSFIIEDGRLRIDTPKIIKINHVRMSVTSTSSLSKEEEESANFQMARIKSIKMIHEERDQFRIVLCTGGSCTARSSQSHQIVTMIHRFITEIQSGKNNESVA